MEHSFSRIRMKMALSLKKFAHDTTAVLSCHLQHFYRDIALNGTTVKQRAIEFELSWESRRLNLAHPNQQFCNVMNGSVTILFLGVWFYRENICPVGSWILSHGVLLYYVNTEFGLYIEKYLSCRERWTLSNTLLWKISMSWTPIYFTGP